MDLVPQEPQIQYTCLIRLPFARGDFVDPPPVDWDSAKDKALWRLISKAANSKDLDWPELSRKFQVSLPFLLQQAAWLYERHFAQMRAQMKKLGTSNAPSPLLAPDSMSGSGLAATSNARQPSGSRPRPASALSAHSKESPSLSTAHPRPGSISRTPSTRTVTQSRLAVQPNSTELAQRSFRSSFNSQRKARPSFEKARGDSSPSPPPESVSSSASSDAGVSQSVARSQVFRRPPDLRTISSGDDGDDDDDPESLGGFLPFATNTHEDPAATATLRTAQPKRAVPDPSRQQDIHYSSESSASSNAAPRQQRISTATRKMPVQSAATTPADALSPRRRAELAKLSPRVRKEGSDGTPSMGSSFSDLDDASVTQSALEEALLSNIQHGGMASRMSNLSSALRSKYLQ
ncbi:hypothetical protein MBLNU457_4900t1 [Dothideomycetes sp. NU457]